MHEIVFSRLLLIHNSSSWVLLVWSLGFYFHSEVNFISTSAHMKTSTRTFITSSTTDFLWYEVDTLLLFSFFICVIKKLWCSLTHCWSPCSHTARSWPLRWAGRLPFGSVSRTWWQLSRWPAQRSHSHKFHKSGNYTTLVSCFGLKLPDLSLSFCQHESYFASNLLIKSWKRTTRGEGLTLKLRFRLGTFCSGWKRMM